MIRLLMVVDRLNIENVVIDVVGHVIDDCRPANVRIERISEIRGLVGLIMMSSRESSMTNHSLWY